MLDKNLIGIEPDFSKNSNYNPDANVAQVKFGADAPVLEVELNELQQVQDKAREDLIRSMIPSGFTKPVEINHYHEKTSSNVMVIGNDAEAYVNGIRICIPKGTRIELGDSPKKETREDLVFLEVWKEEVNSKTSLKKYGGDSQETIPNNLIDPRVGEETSHRVINRWRIRCAHGVNFKANPDGLRQAGTSFDDANVFAQGGREKPITKEDSIELFTCLFSQTNTDSVDNSVRNWNYKDSGLYIAGKGNESKDTLKTFDGYSLAIPMFRLHRRPNQGFSTGDYANISPLTNTSKLENLLKNEKLSSVATGEVECTLEGNTLYNLVNGAPSLAIQNSDKITSKVNGDSITLKRAVAGDTGFIYVGVPINLSALEFNTDYTVVFEASGKVACDDAYLNIMTGSALEDVAGAKFKRKVGRNVVHIRTYSKSKKLSGQILYVGVNSYNGNISLPNLQDEMTLKNFMILKGKIKEEDLPKYFKGFKSVGDYSVKLDRFVSWGAEVANGTSQENIATIPIQLINPYIKVVPVNLSGEEINDGNVAFRLFDASNRELGWSSCPDILYSEKYKEVSYVKVFCNSVASNNKISGFNIYTGSNIIIKSVIDSNNESVLELQTNEPLRSIPYTSIKDLAFGDGRVCRKIAKGVLDDTNNWSSYVLTSNDSNYLIFQQAIDTVARTKLFGEFKYKDIYSDDDTKQFNEEFIGLYKGGNHNSEWIYLCIDKTKLSSQNLEGLRAYLREHPIVYYYQPKETYVEESLYPSLKNYDDFNGNITENLISVTKLDAFEWLLGTTSGGWTEFGDTIVFYSTSFEDIMQTTSNIFCDALPYVTNIANANKTGIGNAVWGNKAHPAIRIQKSLLSSPDVSGFKQWLKSTGIRLVYEAISPKMTKYPMEYAEVQGNLIFTNDSKAKVLCDSIIQPKVKLEHKADLKLDLFKGACLVDVISKITPKFEIKGQVSESNSLLLNVDSQADKEPLKILGKTLVNIKTKLQVQATGCSITSDAIIIDNSTERDGGIMLLTPTIKPDTTYTLVYTVTKNTKYSGTFKLDGYIDYPINTKEIPTTVGIHAISFTTRSAYTNLAIKIATSSDVIEGSLLELSKDMLIIEGDWTNKAIPSYFEGVKSVGELEGNTIASLSRNKNLINIESCLIDKKIKYNFNSNTYSFYTNNSLFSRGIYLFNPNDKNQYTASCRVKLKTATSFRIGLVYTDGTFANSNVCNSSEEFIDLVVTSNPNKRLKMLRLDWSTEGEILMQDFQLEIGSTKTGFEKPKLSLKSTMLEEPLRGLDDSLCDIQYDNSKETLVKRVLGQYTFTGKENFTDWLTGESPEVPYCYFFLDNFINYDLTDNRCMCNNFITVKDGTTKKEMISLRRSGDFSRVYICILKSRLRTQDISGLKEWLKENPTTLVFKLPEPKKEVIKSEYNSCIQDYVDFRGQVGYKRTSDSGLDCGVVGLIPVSVFSEWTTGQIRLCNYTYYYNGDIQDLVGVPMRLGAGYSIYTEYNFKIVKVLSDKQVLVQNLGKTLPDHFNRAFFPSFICSTAQSEFTIGDLQKTVSLTGIDYNNLLEKLVCKHLY